MSVAATEVLDRVRAVRTVAAAIEQDGVMPTTDILAAACSILDRARLWQMVADAEQQA